MGKIASKLQGKPLTLNFEKSVYSVDTIPNGYLQKINSSIERKIMQNRLERNVSNESTDRYY